ncbi:hypothetical protein ACN9M1_01510 [Ralstonia sp. R-29]|uniref:hypothetical protein n=1 Tax=Ralstonia sp. R-29 TaxID=3404059 RepID=UPI003CF6479B
MKKLIFAFLLLLVASAPSQACRPAYMSFSPVFAPGANQLSVDELHRLLEWREKTRTAFPNSGEYIVVAPADKALGVPDNLAEQRLQSLIGLLRNIGVPQSDVLYAEVHQRGSGKILPTDKTVMQQALRDINTASIEINPRCPHACCPGPTPIQP